MIGTRNQRSAVRRYVFCIAVGALLLALDIPVHAQQTKKIPRIGYIGSSASEQTASNAKAFRERLHEFGYIEGQNITIEYRYFEGKVERLPEIAADLVRLKCDVIVTTGTEAAQVAKKEIKTVPIVMAFDLTASN